MRRILIVDDDADLRRAVRRMLEDAGYTVDEARNGDEALERCRVAPPQLVLLDVHMPVHDGVETILALVGDELAIPVIAMSGGGWLSQDDSLALMQDLGARAVLEKPFERDELLGLVEGIL